MWLKITSLLTISVGLVAVLVKYNQQDIVTERYRFGSFAPVRNGSGQAAKWYVDGQDYMSAVADAISAAKHEIFIADWQLNPHIFMKRPDTGITSLEWRLDKMLLRKAEEGVRVYILLYYETEVIMELGSAHTQLVLKHNNIEVHRHPTFSTPVHHQRWSHHEKVVIVDRSIAFVGGIDLCFGRWDTHTHDLHDDYPLHPCVLGGEEECEHSGTDEPTKKYRRWVGKDYGNTLLGVVRTKMNKPFEDYINRNEDPRMPWHDVACSITGDAALDVAKHFIQRYNAISRSWWPWNYDQLSVDGWAHPEIRHSIPNSNTNNVNVQVLRSVGSWSAKQPHEDSIHKAYLHTIKNAEHFIYIENQFFISSQSEGKVQNEIQQALCDRIARAYVNGETFHVLILLPLKPEFPEEFGSGVALDSVSYWNYATLFSGEDSLWHKLKRRVPEKYLQRYFSVYSLRTHDILGGKIVTEIIYVHSKLMIVDDRIAIIGSANVNDRSMLGDRDSEVDVIIEDKDMIDGIMNGKSYHVGKFSHGLRVHLMKEHLGLMDGGNGEIDLGVEDPLAGNFFSRLSAVASSNTKVYETVFYRKIIPTSPDSWTFEEMEEWKTHEGHAVMYPEQSKEELRKIQGNIVLFPPLHESLKGVLKPSILFHNMIVDNRNFDDLYNGRRVYV